MDTEVFKELYNFFSEREIENQEDNTQILDDILIRLINIEDDLMKIKARIHNIKSNKNQVEGKDL